MDSITNLRRKYNRLKNRFSRISFQKLSRKKQEQLYRRFVRCEQNLYRLTSSIFLASLGTTTLQGQAYCQQIGNQNPFNGLDVGDWSTSQFIDFDKDGDIDLISGNFEGEVRYFQNDGNNNWNNRTGSNNPFNGIDVGNRSTPYLIDFDEDGDLDLISGERDGLIYYFSNDGNDNFIQQTGSNNPFNDITLTGELSAPQLVDVDRDCDLDLIIGIRNGSIIYHRRKDDGSFELISFFFAYPFERIETVGSSQPKMIDFDKDGDLDLIIGDGAGNISLYLNFGNNRLGLLTGVDNPFEDLDVGRDAVPDLADIDNDGDLDMIIGNRYGSFQYYENVPNCLPTTINGFADCASDTFDEIDTGTLSAPQLVDVDNDGHIDLISGERNGAIFYYRNNGRGKFIAQAGVDNPFDEIDIEGLYSKPQLVDFDSDGDLDLVVGEGLFSSIFYYQNDGTNNFTPLTGSDNPFDGIEVDASTSPNLADLDNDGDLDLVVGEIFGRVLYYRNDGNEGFIPLTDNSNPFKDVNTGYYSAPQLLDVDQDSDLDLIVGGTSGRIQYYQNIGNNEFIRQLDEANPLDEIDVDTRSTPQLVDADQDGDLDFISGNADGQIIYRQNTDLSFSASTVDCNKNEGAVEININSSQEKSPFGINSDIFFGEIGEEDVSGTTETIITEVMRPGNYSFELSVAPFDCKLAATEVQIDEDCIPARESEAFCEQVEIDNPFDGINDGIATSVPQLVDFDDDGDMDLVVAASIYSFDVYGFIYEIQYFQNDDNIFIQQIESDNPFDTIESDSRSIPQVVDVDQDGNLDLILGGLQGLVRYFRNDGNNNFIQQIGSDNPFEDIDMESSSAPQLIDFDGDEDLDLIIGNFDGQVWYYQNNGNNDFVEQFGEKNPFDRLELGRGSIPKPQVVDVDQDGDLDLIIGSTRDGIEYYINNGSNRFTPLNSTEFPFFSKGRLFNVSPQLVDFDADGNLELVLGASNSGIRYYENNPSCLSSNINSFVDCANDPFDEILLNGNLSSIVRTADVDNDGHLDLICGERFGRVVYYRNIDGKFIQQFDENDPFKNAIVNGNTIPQMVDVDLDGDLDLVVGTYDAYTFKAILFYFRNDDGNFIQQTDSDNPFSDYSNPFTLTSIPYIADLDNDNDLDIIAGNFRGLIQYYENDGNNNFIEQTGINNPFDAVDVIDAGAPQLIDIDSDGDLDLIGGNTYGEFFYYKNDGDNNFIQQTGSINPFKDLALGYFYSTPHLADIDGDGDLDLLSGESFDKILYFQNTNLSVVASPVICDDDRRDIEIKVSSDDTEGAYHISKAFYGSIGEENVLGANEVLMTGITASGAYTFEISDVIGCAQVASVVNIFSQAVDISTLELNTCTTPFTANFTPVENAIAYQVELTLPALNNRIITKKITETNLETNIRLPRRLMNTEVLVRIASIFEEDGI